MSEPSTSGRERERDSSHALSTITARFTLHLHPCKLQDVMEGVREQLNMGLLRYSEDLGGVVLAYSGEALASGPARLHPYFPFAAVAVTARVTLFCPRPGQHLVGRVIKVGADYIGLLLLGVFNAAIGADAIRREFKCSPETGSWVSVKDPGHRIKVGSYVRFSVESVLDQAGLFTVTGSLREPGTGEEQHCSPSIAKAGKVADAVAGMQQHKAHKGQQQKYKHTHKQQQHQHQHQEHQQQDGLEPRANGMTERLGSGSGSKVKPDQKRRRQEDGHAQQQQDGGSEQRHKSKDGGEGLQPQQQQQQQQQLQQQEKQKQRQKDKGERIPNGKEERAHDKQRQHSSGGAKPGKRKSGASDAGNVGDLSAKKKHKG